MARKCGCRYVYTRAVDSLTDRSLLLDVKLCLRLRNCHETQVQSSAYKTRLDLSFPGFTDHSERVNKASDLAHWSHGPQGLSFGLHNAVTALAGQYFGVSTSLLNFSCSFLNRIVTILSIPTAQATHIFLDDYVTQTLVFK